MIVRTGIQTSTLPECQQAGSARIPRDVSRRSQLGCCVLNLRDVYEMEAVCVSSGEGGLGAEDSLGVCSRGLQCGRAEMNVRQMFTRAAFVLPRL